MSFIFLTFFRNVVFLLRAVARSITYHGLTIPGRVEALKERKIAGPGLFGRRFAGVRGEFGTGSHKIKLPSCETCELTAPTKY
jgi:hypothetical protein